MRVLVLMAFFVSGFTSLVLETLWVRMLTLVFGGTTLAIVTVLTAFMGGLALGSWQAGRFTDRFKRPVMIYGFLEIAIALYALLLPFLIDMLPLVYRLLPETWPFLLTALIRFVLCVLLLLIPTTLMGATLPILSHFFVRRRALIGFDVGLLYSTNTFGAVIGTFTGGFLLLPMLGHQATLFSVTGFLVLVALAMVSLGSRLEATGLDEQESQDTPEEAQEIAPKETHPMEPEQARKIAVVCIALTGATAMICQVIWSRALAMVIGSSTYAFTLILVIFLIGLAGGALWGSWVARRSYDVSASWGLFLLGSGISVALGSFFMDRLPMLFIKLVYGLPKTTGPTTLFLFKALVAAVPIVVPTLLMGAFFPLALALYTQHKGNVGQSVGQLYAANTLGSIIGSASTGFIVIPLLGLRGGLALCATCYFACAVWLAMQKKHERRISFAVVGIIGALVVWFLPNWHTGRMSLGQFRLSLLRRSASVAAAARPGNVLFYKEGVSATVSVEGGKLHRALKVNGKTDASNHGDASTQIGVSFFPMLLHKKPKDVAIVGWGSGMSVGAALQWPAKRVTAVELEPAVVAASPWFRPWNFSPQLDKRLKLLYNDGRNFLATTTDTFDVIVSVPSNPWMAGVANLFTTNYFKITKKRLKPGGIFCQWVQVYELSRRNILSILRSIRSVYPHVRFFEIELDSYDLLLMGSNQPIPFDLDHINSALKQEKVKKKLLKIMGIRNAYDVLPRFLGSGKELDKILKSHKIWVPLNTDDHNRLEFTAPLDLVTQSNSNDGEIFRKSVNKYGRNFATYASFKGQKMGHKKPLDFWLRAIQSHLYYGSIGTAAKLFKKHAVKRTPAKPSQLYKETRRLVALMDGKERPPALPTAKPLAKHAKLFAKLKLAKKLYYADKDEKCISTLSAPETEPSFVKKYEHVYFYLAACSRYSDDYKQSFRYFTRYIRHPKVTPPTSAPKNTPPKRDATKKGQSPAKAPAKKATTRPAPSHRGPAKKAAKRGPAKRAPAKRAPAKRKAPAKRAPASKKSPAKKAVPTRR